MNKTCSIWFVEAIQFKRSRAKERLVKSERVCTNMVVIQVLIAMVITIVSVFPNRSSPNRFFNVHRNLTDVLPFLLFFPSNRKRRNNYTSTHSKSKPRVTGDKWAGRASLTAAADAGSVCTGQTLSSPTRAWEIYLTPIGVYWVAIKWASWSCRVLNRVTNTAVGCCCLGNLNAQRYTIADRWGTGFECGIDIKNFITRCGH